MIQNGYYMDTSTRVTAPDFLKFLGLLDSGMERYPSPKLAADIHLTTSKISFNYEQKYFFNVI